MSTSNNKISIYQGNSDQIFCSVTDSSSLAMDLTGYTGMITVKKKKSDTSNTIQKIHTSLDASAGTLTFDLTPTETDITPGDYNYDITIDNSTNVYSVVQEKLVIVDSVRY